MKIDVTKEHPIYYNKKYAENIHIWDENYHKIEEWMKYLNFINVLLTFLGEYLKEREAIIGWWIIVITTLISFITLFDLEKLGTDYDFNNRYQWGKSVALSILSIITTLLAAWSKKKQFIKRIKEIDKKVNELERFIGTISCTLGLPTKHRTNYVEFYHENIEKYKELCCYNQFITPTEVNFVLYRVTKFYPTLIGESWPWYIEDKEGKEMVPNIKFGHDIIKSYEYTYYTGTFWSKLIYCFYCRSKCCWPIDDGNPFTIENLTSLDPESNTHIETTRKLNLKKSKIKDIFQTELKKVQSEIDSKLEKNRSEIEMVIGKKVNNSEIVNNDNQGDNTDKTGNEKK